MNCGKEVSDDAVFCTGCGAKISAAADTDTTGQGEIASTAAAGQAAAEGAYYGAGVQEPSGGTYYQAGTPNTQGSVPYTQPAPPNYQPGAQNAYYPGAPYGGGSPGYPGGPGKKNTSLIVIVSVIIGLVLIGGGILTYFLITGKNNVDNPRVSVTDIIEPSEVPLAEPSEEPSAKPSEEPSAEPSNEPELPTAEPSAEPSAVPALLDETILANIEEACFDTGMDVSKMSGLEYYGAWYEGEVYTFTYKDSVIDVLLYEDGTVFSIETAGVQVYLINYDSFYMDDFLGSQTHFDESYPDNSYVFFIDRELLDADFGFITIDTSYDLDYLVALIDANTGNAAIAFYVRAGQSVPMPVPSGDYFIQYAAGPSWVSFDEFFGADMMLFRSDSAYSVSGDNEPFITLDVYGGSGIPATDITGGN